MTLPSAATKVHLDAATDDPKQARAELASLVDKFNDTLTHLNLSAVTSTPYAIGNGLEASGSNIVVKPNTSNGSLIDVTSSGVRVGYSDANSLQWALHAYNNNTGASSAAGVLTTINKANMAAALFCGDGYAQITTGSAIASFKARAAVHIWSNQADTTEYMRLDSNGRLGIGTSGPDTKLMVFSSSGAPDIYAVSDQASGYAPARFGLRRRGSAAAATPNNSLVGEIRFDGVDANAAYAEFAAIRASIGTNAAGGAPGVLAFETAPSGAATTERMRITSTGNVGIGTTSPGQKLTVAGTIESTTGGVKFPDGTTQTTAATSSTITLGTAIATTSGSSHEFAGLPSGIDRLVFMIDKISCNGSGIVYVQLGTGGSIVTTGYECVYHDDAPATVTNTTGFQINDASIVSDIVTGQIVFHRVTGNTWVGTGIITGDNSGIVYVAQTSGRIALSGALDRVRIVNASSNAFDAGQVNIQYQD